MIACYAKADLLLQLPLSEPMDVFTCRRQYIPLAVRTFTDRPSETRAKLGIDDRRPAMLLPFRDNPQMTAPFAEISGQFHLLSTLSEDVTGVRPLDPAWQLSPFPSLVSISEVVVAKLGYGIASECIAYRTPLLYPERRDFAEFPVLADAIKGYVPAAQVTEAEFANGAWVQRLYALVDEAKSFEYPPVCTHGATVAAEYIVHPESTFTDGRRPFPNCSACAYANL